MWIRPTAKDEAPRFLLQQEADAIDRHLDDRVFARGAHGVECESPRTLFCRVPDRDVTEAIRMWMKGLVAELVTWYMQGGSSWYPFGVANFANRKHMVNWRQRRGRK